jgi:GT2 family glycosyltransferase
MSATRYATVFLGMVKDALGKNCSPRAFPAFCLRALRVLASSEGRRALMSSAAQRGVMALEDAAIYDLWVKHHAPAHHALQDMARHAQRMARKPLFSIVIPVQHEQEQWVKKSVESVLSQAYPFWELFLVKTISSADTLCAAVESEARDKGIRVIHISEGALSSGLNQVLSVSNGEFACLLYPGDELAPEALFEVARALNEKPGEDLCYSDEDKLDALGHRHEPFFKPDWSPEYLESFNYVRHLACFRVALARKVGGFGLSTRGATEHDFLIRLTEETTNIHHIPKVLYHARVEETTPPSGAETDQPAMVQVLSERLERLHVRGTVAARHHLPGCFDVRQEVQGAPLVSIVIPSAGRSTKINGQEVDLLANCIQSILDKSLYRTFEVIVVDNDDLRQSTLERIVNAGCRFVHYQEQFNVARKMNLGAREAQGEYLLFLNDDTEVISPDWLTVMLQLAQRAEIGVVGVKLFFEDGTIQHMGVAFNDDGFPDHICSGFPRSFSGYFHNAAVNCNYLAVTGACSMTRREVFEKVGGFNEEFAVNYNDVDYCLRLGESGLRVVFTPHAELFHFESRNRERVVERREIELFGKLWSLKTRRDPYYSFHLESKPPHFHVKHILRYS